MLIQQKAVSEREPLFCFIGNSDPEDTKNKHMSVKHMLVKGQMSIKTRL